jgi:hypothetical protein
MTPDEQAQAEELHGPDCADAHDEECENDGPCRQSDWGLEPPDIYHQCDSPEHFITPDHEGT